MGWLYRILQLQIHSKTWETKTNDEGTIEMSSDPKVWKEYRDRTYPLFSRFYLDTDEHGVKMATYIDNVGYHYKAIREKKPDQKKENMKFGVRDKVNYFSKRVNDKSLSVGQRKYAESRLMALRKN